MTSPEISRPKASRSKRCSMRSAVSRSRETRPLAAPHERSKGSPTFLRIRQSVSGRQILPTRGEGQASTAISERQDTTGGAGSRALPWLVRRCARGFNGGRSLQDADSLRIQTHNVESDVQTGWIVRLLCYDSEDNRGRGSTAIGMPLERERLVHAGKLTNGRAIDDVVLRRPRACPRPELQPRMLIRRDREYAPTSKSRALLHTQVRVVKCLAHVRWRGRARIRSQRGRHTNRLRS